MVKKTLIVSFSGGRTSAYMCKWLLDNMSHVFNFFFVYANTGQEHENTLKFVNACDKAFGLNLVWLEAVINPGFKKVTTHTIVNYETACRDGRLFEDMCEKYGLPNKSWPHCTRELKIRPITSWEKDNNLESAQRALGIRSDEAHRAKRDGKRCYPLTDLVTTTKEDILNWWRKQSFDLDLPEHLGNCTWCFKKSFKKLLTIASEEPSIMGVPLWLESKYSKTGTGAERILFREHRTTVDILQMAQGDFNKYVDLHHEECVEECGSVIPEEIEE